VRVCVRVCVCTCGVQQQADYVEGDENEKDEKDEKGVNDEEDTCTPLYVRVYVGVCARVLPA